MSDVIDRFLTFHHEFNDISPRRRHDQRRVIRDFERFLGDTPVEAAGAAELSDYLAELVRRGMAPSTVWKQRNMVKPFYSWAWDRQIITGDQLMQIRNVRAPRGATGGLPRPYPSKDIKRLWAEFDAQYPAQTDYFVNRWRKGHSPWRRVQGHAQRLQLHAILGLALFGGLRNREIFDLDLEEMHYDNDYVVVHGARKNPDAESRTRVVPMCPPLYDALEAWIEFREQIDPPHDRPWLSLHRNHRLKPLRYRRYVEFAAHLGSGWELHRLRHTFATERLRAGMPLEVLRQIMGHSSIAQTLQYAQLLDSDIVNRSKSSDKLFTNAVAPRRPTQEIE